MNDLTVVVGTCDNYEKAWNPFSHGMLKYWRDKPKNWNVVCITNFKKFPVVGWKTINVQKDSGWSDAMRRGLQQVSSKVILFMMEDAWLTHPVKTGIIIRYVNEMHKRDLNHIRLFPTWGKCGVKTCSYKGLYKHDRSLAVFADDSAYRVSLHCGLWKKSTFLQLLSVGKSVWDFEIKGSPTTNFKPGFLCVKEHGVMLYGKPLNTPDKNYQGYITRGQWTEAADWYFQREGIGK